MPQTTSFHRAYRRLRARGLGRIDSLNQAKKENWELYKNYCRMQERGEQLEPLDEKEEARINQIRATGKLI